MAPEHTVRGGQVPRSPRTLAWSQGWGMGRWLWVCTLLLLLTGLGSAFNLDTSARLIKEGAKGSFFGFSLALHQQLTPVPKSLILVGAPRARGIGSMSNIHPGALFQCNITAEEYDCARVDIDGDMRVDRESKDNQWLGVTVKSQGIGGKVVTCAHLYELRQRVRQPSETRDPIGRCYVLSEDLTERDDLDGGEWKFCEGRPQGHEQFGFCQQGMSASFTPDNNFILFGAPGTYNWKGLMFLASPIEDALVYKSLEPSSRPVFEDVAQNSYLGFSVDSAVGLLSRTELTFVAGAPRANHTGAVVLLRKDNVYRLVPKHILWGEELASSFGYSVATADLNSDGWTDLIVGAPNFFDRKAEIGGAVYVYLNPSGHWYMDRPIRLNGTYDSMFGMTVSSVGDLDQDGYGDFAVGAPFDGDGKVFIYRGAASGLHTKPSQVLDGVTVGVERFGYSISGGLDIDENQYPDLAVGSLSDKVVLYRSSPVIHILRDITIEPHLIDLEQHNCKGRDGVCVEVKACFAYSAHPESYSPRITLTVLFEADTERRKLGLPHRVNFLGRSRSELEFFHSEEVKLHGQKHPACQTATFQLKESLWDKLRPISLAITHTIKHTHHHRHVGPEHLAMLTPVLSTHVSNTLLSEVNFLREGCGDDKVCQSNLQLVWKFCTKAHPADPFTPLSLDEDGVPVFTLKEQRPVALELEVSNFPSDPENDQEDGDDAHAAKLQIILPETLSFDSVRRHGHGQQVLCEANQNGSQVDCDLGNPFKRGGLLKFYIALSTAAFSIETTELSVDLILSTISEQPDLAPITAKAKVEIELPLAVSVKVNPHRLFFSGAVKGESAMQSLDDIGSPVEIDFQVTSTFQTPHTLGSAFLNIMWPHELSNGKWLLYPTGVESEDPSLRQCIDPSEFDPIPIVPKNATKPTNLQTLSRKVRSYSEEEGEAMTKGSVERTTPAVAASEKRKSLKLDCLLGSARCKVYSCPLQSVSDIAILKIKARLWNSSFIEEFPSASALELMIRANISVKSTIKHLVLRATAAEVPVEIYPEHRLSDPYAIPWWIILIAILAGILVLALLVCLLWKCGFFRRAQYKDKVPQYHAVKIPRQDRPQFQDEKSVILHKKEWATHWSDGTS
ncbi:integrin alpha-7 isoform X2 [Sardina pilchardus]|uniref:integrin alpha-7 isoform X2 n=1 Tax=Sardina pilchardus TaxID=27697 RepID=UPI002E1433D6